MVLLDWPPPDHLGIGRKRGNSCQRKHPAAILALGSSYAPTVAAQTRIVSAAGIRLDHRKSVRPFKGRFCNNISEFESDMPSHAVGSLWRVYPVHAPATKMALKEFFTKTGGGPRVPARRRNGSGKVALRGAIIPCPCRCTRAGAYGCHGRQPQDFPAL